MYIVGSSLTYGEAAPLLLTLTRPVMFGGDLVSTGLVGGCRRAGVVWVPVNKPGKTLNGDYDYAMAA